MQGSRRGRWRSTVAVLVGVVSLSACTSVSGGFTEDGEESGYVSGDGSVTAWDGEERPGPVQVAGITYAGESVDVADWRGDVVVLNTWYAACPPCRTEAPVLKAVAEDYADDGVHLLGVNGTDAPGAAEAFERTFEVPYPSIHDEDGTALASLQGVVPVQAVPTTVVVDREGRVYARILGAVDETTLRALVEDALEETGT
ncbi:TlpA family protein disulfide reductase [Actinotalea ferrariae]|nr:TlpA family protein disulfide reductase [Actinotalea ferrariae]